jgi:CobQ-like glutamine amidotransferase family enzyme
VGTDKNVAFDHKSQTEDSATSTTLTLSLLMLHICGVSKKFGDWYQKTKKTEDTNKLTLLAFKIIAILQKYKVGNIHKASGSCQQRPL